MEPVDPDYAARVAAIFEGAPFVQHLGIQLIACGPGWCEAHMALSPHHMQQTGVVHAGALATLNDHTCGGAATTLLAPGQHVVSVEFKNNMLRGASGERLECRAEVLKQGRSIGVIEAKCYAVRGDVRQLVSSMTCTLMVLG
jgi:uncharacterized protein (TIGR00369 family)